MERPTYQPALHRLALLTAAATFPLIFMGGLVTSHGAGMSVPDWPNSYGYNMFTFPPSKWVGGILYEHTHRLMGTVVGMLSIALTIVAWRCEPRRWVRWLATGVLGAVVFQGVLGGLRVVMVELDLAIVHACFAQAFFCLAALTAVVTSRWWIDAPQHVESPADAQGMRGLAALGLVATGLIYAQLIVGAVMRHYEAGLAMTITQLLPPASNQQLAATNAWRTYELHQPSVTMGQAWLHFGHRVGAVLVSVAIAAVVVRAIRSRRRAAREPLLGAITATLAAFIAVGAADALGSSHGMVAGVSLLFLAVVALLVMREFIRRMGDARPILAPAALVTALLFIQVTLGILTVALRKPADIASAHVAVGALTLVTTFVLAVRAMRLNALAVAQSEAADAVGGQPEPATTYYEQPVLAA